MYIFQEKNRYFAQCADDIKDLAEKELASLGGYAISKAYRGMYFSASMTDLYKINYRSRFFGRILAPLTEFKAFSEDELYEGAKRNISWSDIIPTGCTFAVQATLVHSNIRHSKFAALKLKDAIVDQMRSSRYGRPDVDTKSPDVGINLHIQNNKAVISVDTSGGSLHKRGYRSIGHEAPMMETLAAAIIEMTEWDGSKPLIDPMCGSGTLLCEALLKATQTPAGILRPSFGFEKLPGFNEKDWKRVRSTENDRSEALGNRRISGSDISNKAVQFTRNALEKLPFGKEVNVSKMDMFDIETIEDSILVFNPPYGIRLNDGALDQFYSQVGDFLKHNCKGSIAYIYFGDRKYIKNIGLRASMKRPLSNGKLDGRLTRFDLY